jgi:hypothetical protein
MNGYNKTKSIILLKLLYLPTLDFIIISKWNQEIKKRIEVFSKIIKSNQFLLRHDKCPERPPYPRGGYIVNIDNIEFECKNYFKQNRIVLLLEPYSPYDNLYNINILYDKESIIFEVLGPGFDISDLQRGDQSPHEILYFFNSKEYDHRIMPYSHAVISNEDYRESVKKRYQKIGFRLIEHGLIKNNKKKNLMFSAKQYLINNGFKLLPENEHQYKKISIVIVKQLYQYVYNLESEINHFYNNVRFPFVVSSTLINKSKSLTFWDMVFPLNKYNI